MNVLGNTNKDCSAGHTQGSHWRFSNFERMNGRLNIKSPMKRATAICSLPNELVKPVNDRRDGIGGAIWVTPPKIKTDRDIRKGRAGGYLLVAERRNAPRESPHRRQIERVEALGFSVCRLAAYLYSIVARVTLELKARSSC